MTVTVKHPESGFTGQVSGIDFIAGVGDVDHDLDAAAAAVLTDHGYTIESSKGTSAKSDAADDLSALTVPKLTALAKAKGIEVPKGAKKDEILALFAAPEKATESEDKQAD